MNDAHEPAQDASMDGIQRDARHIAADAAEQAEQSRPAAATGERPELTPRAPPALDLRGSDAIHRADQARAADDVQTAERQQGLASGQESAAESLRRVGEQLHASRAELDKTRDRVSGTSARAEDIASTAERLGDRVSRLRDQVRGTPPPEGEEEG